MDGDDGEEDPVELDFEDDDGVTIDGDHEIGADIFGTDFDDYDDLEDGGFQIELDYDSDHSTIC